MADGCAIAGRRAPHRLGWLAALVFVAVPARADRIELAECLPAPGPTAIERMPSLPEPLAVRDWRSVARDYYQTVFDPARAGEGFPAVQVDADHFRMKSYLGLQFDTEAFCCLAAVAGAELVGLDPQALHGTDYLARTAAWYDPEIGLFRHRAGQRGPVVSADIYGYWPAVLGLILADQHPDNAPLRAAATTTFAAFREIARGVGVPHTPDFDSLGWNFQLHARDGRQEPMNRLGHAPTVAWALLAGHAQTGDEEMLALSRETLAWYADHPGRYETTHMMGPLTAARLNVLADADDQRIDLDAVLRAWLGDGAISRHSWCVTAGTRLSGLTCDGLDAAHEGAGFYAFTMGSLQNPAWLVPVVRYEPSYAATIGRLALHAANSCRLLQGIDLPADQQDHAAWKERHDPGNLFFYEGLMSAPPAAGASGGPYATGDPVRCGWTGTGHPGVGREEYLAERGNWFGEKPYNIALYMGNSVGFLGGIVQTTDVPGILAWDCVATDWFHPPAFPTLLLWNPYADSRDVHLPPEGEAADRVPVDIYDLVSRRFLARNAAGSCQIHLPGHTAVVAVKIPASATLSNQAGRFLADGIVVDWTAPGPE